MKNYSLSHNGFIYTIDKEPSESNDIFMKRLWYIVKKNPKTQSDLEKYIDLSLIWRNVTFYKNEYDAEVMNSI